MGTSTSRTGPDSHGPGSHEARFRRQRGKNFCAFIDHRIPIVAAGLSPENRAKFEAKPYSWQFDFVVRLIEKGVLI
jgi:hypothetical protein